MEACGACGSSIAWGPGSDWAGSGSGSPSRRIGGIGGRSLTLISFGNAEWLFFPRLFFRAFIIGRYIATELFPIPVLVHLSQERSRHAMEKVWARSAAGPRAQQYPKAVKVRKCCQALPERELAGQKTAALRCRLCDGVGSNSPWPSRPDPPRIGLHFYSQIESCRTERSE